MKKLFLLAVIAMALAFTSCNKNYTCVCTTFTGTAYQQTFIINDTKSGAKKKCTAELSANGTPYYINCAIQ